ncbi:MFS transporter, partial [Acinetobacter pecorum]|uniref:MFS transporter n=1 Tax=Acinetobacter pecorum TaxID=2762215 RepID=UPI003EE6E82D
TFSMGLLMLYSKDLLVHFKVKNLIIVSLVLILVSNLIRYFTSGILNLILTSIVLGFSIAVLQITIPLIIKSKFKSHISMMMGIYITGLMIGAAISSGSVALISNYFHSWEMAISIWWVFTIPPLLLMLFFASKIQDVVYIKSPQTKISINTRSWFLVLFFFLSSASYSCISTWLPPYYIELGRSNSESGLILSNFIIFQIIAGFLFPYFSRRNEDRRSILITLIFITVLGFIGLITAPLQMTMLWSSLLGLGVGGLFPLSLILTLDHYKDPIKSTKLISFVQGFGYILASITPFAAGLLKDATGNFMISWVILIVMTVLMIPIALIFDPKHYDQIMK